MKDAGASVTNVPVLVDSLISCPRGLPALDVPRLWGTRRVLLQTAVETFVASTFYQQTGNVDADGNFLTQPRNSLLDAQAFAQGANAAASAACGTSARNWRRMS